MPAPGPCYSRNMNKSIIGLVLALACGEIGADVVVLYQDRETRVAHTLADPNDLWVHPEDLPRVNGFTLKPEGACVDDICVPVRQQVNSDIFLTRNGERWFNVTELANRIQQPHAADESGVWSLGAIPAQRARFVERAEAPDFGLQDLSGKTVHLSDFKGMKIMLLSWASW